MIGSLLLFGSIPQTVMTSSYYTTSTSAVVTFKIRALMELITASTMGKSVSLPWDTPILDPSGEPFIIPVNKGWFRYEWSNDGYNVVFVLVPVIISMMVLGTLTDQAHALALLMGSGS